MRWIGTLLVAWSLVLAGAHTCHAQSELIEQLLDAVKESRSKPKKSTTPANATHEVLKTVSVTGDAGKLQTLAATPDGKIVALVSRGRMVVDIPLPSGAAPKTPAEIHLLDADGEEIRQWALEFNAQSVGVDPQGQIYVAGDGQLARYSQEGELLAKAEVPHIVETLRDDDKLRESAEAQIKAQTASYEQAIEQTKKQVEELEAKADELNDQEKQQLEAHKVNLKFYQQLVESREEQSVENVMKSLTARLRIINSISATENEVFIACGELKGYGYSVWRMDHDFKKAEQVMSKLGGCCGQMDVQAQGGNLFVAENTRHRVGQYDRDGKPVTTFGKRDRKSEGECFAGCCNPMNCRVTASGDVYTAESEGIVKKFNSKGEFVALIGKAPLTGGCKNVAVAASPSGDKVYFCDLPGSKIVILGERKGSGTEKAAE